MQEAITEAYNGIQNQEGGPFGSVVVKNGEIVGKGHNQVLLLNDPTCHGEVQAIRNACQTLNTYDLSDCELYTTGEPCPMCLAACKWANLKKVYYGCTIQDNADIGFRDELFYNLFGINKSLVTDFLECMERDACKELFETYKKSEKTMY